MGQSIGLLYATNGFAVILYDIDDEILSKGKESMTKKIYKMAANWA
jgi:3-hydroxyacyl-CoA dehydrogenase